MNKQFASAVLVGVIIVGGYIAYREHVPVETPPVIYKAASEVKQEKAEIHESIAISGLNVTSSVAMRRPIAVMVENHPDARPVSGLSDADIVYEALAEGGITRYMPVYQTVQAKNIGPIRSSRTYYAEIANELGAVYAHVGGNSDALENIKSGVYSRISDADQFFNDSYFHRIHERSAPHNVYTSIEKLDQLIAIHHYSTSSTASEWKFKEDSSVETPNASTITIDFSLKDYLVGYTYNAKQNSYGRLLSGRPHIDPESHAQLAAKNIIVQMVETYPVVSDTPLAIGLGLTGSGKAYIFRDGTVIEGVWKSGQEGRTRYYSDSGQEITLNRGSVWVELLPINRSVYWK